MVYMIFGYNGPRYNGTRLYKCVRIYVNWASLNQTRPYNGGMYITKPRQI